VPNADRLVDANYAATTDAWITGPGRSTETIVTYLRERLVGCDTLAKDHAIELVEQVLEVTRRHASETFRQPLVSPENVGGRIETLYFDGPRELDWPAFAFVGGEPYIVLDRQHVTRVIG
jgi:hypothetical protein